MVDASIRLFSNLRIKISSPSYPFLELLKASVSLVLFALTDFNGFFPEEESDKKQKLIRVFGGLDRDLKNWIIEPRVIGGSMFGGSTNPRHWKAEEEIRVYIGIMLSVLCIRSFLYSFL